MWSFLRWRLNELLLVAVLVMFAVHLSPAWWLAVSFVAAMCARQEWRTHRIPAEPVTVPDGTDISGDQERAARG